jgi:hypothetical protein
MVLYCTVTFGTLCIIPACLNRYIYTVHLKKLGLVKFSHDLYLKLLPKLQFWNS